MVQVFVRTFLWGLVCCLPHAVHGQDESSANVAGNERVAEIMQTFTPRGVQADDSSPTPPEAAESSFKTLPGFRMELVASEPDISQPLFLSWDSQGRMWVVQYRQYQYPAGLKVVRFDQHLRAVFDRVPQPPPDHVRGQDRITVFEDTTGDGRYDSHRDVITGLNIATSVAIGRGGIWVLNPPYLLFYPDQDRDAVPDGEPQVHLSGFGLQDTHSVANSLLWGPDGWLYGANGSTTAGTIRSAATAGVSFQGQCIWRYDPMSERFEIYAEGGGNTFSLEIDSRGRVFSGTNGGNTRGWYYPQGSYSRKNWGKHGPLTNPYAFGFFEAMKFEGDGRRFPQAFLIYEGGLLPQAQFDGSIIAPNAMQNLVWHSARLPDGSSYRTQDQPNLVECSDRWFRPVYAGVGPDGAVYIADWYDTRLSHVSPTDDWHKESGRVYRLRPEGQLPKYEAGDLAEMSDDQLISLFDHSNKWVRRRAVLELGWRPRAAPSTEDRLVQLVEQSDSLEALWAINLRQELTTDRARRWLRHAQPDIRRWVVRLLGDRHESLAELEDLAKQESDLQVRSQLAATARRLDPEVGLAIARGLLRTTPDDQDPQLPLMIWWAVEAHASDWPAMRGFLSEPDVWQAPLMEATIGTRLMRRYAATGTSEDLQICAELIDLAPDEASRDGLIAGLNQAFQGRTLPPLPATVDQALQAYRRSRGESGLALAVRQGDRQVVPAAVRALRNPQSDPGLRIELVRALSSQAAPEALQTLLQFASGQGHQDPALQRVALQALVNYADDRIPQQLTRGFDREISAEHDLRDTACRTLASREPWALALLNEVNNWRLKPSDIPADVVQRLRTYETTAVSEAVVQAFGKPAAITSEEKVASIRRLTEYLSRTQGDVQHGQALFQQHCGKCHRLFGQGQSIGPALDNYDRDNLKFWLPAIIAPSIEIREGYQSYAALTVDGRVVTGMIAFQDPQTISLRTADNQLVVLDRGQLESFSAINTSLMPEGALTNLSDQHIADLFAYLRSRPSADPSRTQRNLPDQR